MRQWRVGTFSMGILLIAVGIALLVAQIKQYAVVEAVTTWWPVIFILLGCEILAYIHFSKEEHPKIKYDFASILLVLFLTMFGLGFYALTATGFLPRVSQMVMSREYTVLFPEARLVVPAEVKKIRVDTPSAQLKLAVSSSRELVAYGDANIFAKNEVEAKKLSGEDFILLRAVGDTLYVELRDLPRKRDFNPGATSAEYRLILPADIPVEIAHDGFGSLEIAAEGIRSDWMVNTRSPVEIAASSQANLEVRAKTRSGEMLFGNVDWQISGQPRRDTEMPDTNDRPDRQQAVQASVKWGEGKYKLYVNSEDRITVNRLD